MNNIKKLFVPYQEAFDMEQLGFEEDCFCYYNKDLKLSNIGRFYSYDNPIDFICLAPTQSLLSKWLRVKYNYNINVKHITHNQKYGFSVTGNYDEKTGGIIIPYNFKGYDSYGECLENALQQCLNIIKNK